MHVKKQTAIVSLAVIMAFRMLGLFMLLPVFALYTHKIALATPTLIGLALGIYGLAQACFQIAFGILSDYIGRKPVLAGGLILLGLGSVVAAVAHSIYGVIIGRAIQGAGAIGSTALATIVDLTRDEDRSKAMALVGMIIGFSFAASLILGPIINAWFQLSGIFWVTVLLAGFSIILLYTTVPTPPRVFLHPQIRSKQNYFKRVLCNTQLLRLDLGIFSLHCILTAFFIGIPVMLSQIICLTEQQQVLLYLIIMLLTFIVIIPLVIIMEKQRKLKSFFIGSTIVLVICPISLCLLPHSFSSISIVLFFFFIAFTLLEAILPSIISKVAPIPYKGTAMGIYSSAQFFGIFFGGSIGGWIFDHFHILGLFTFCTIIGSIWLAIVILMKQPLYLSTITVRLNKPLIIDLAVIHQDLYLIEGVSEVVVSHYENLIYLKFDKKIISENELRKRIRQSTLDTD
ncbi:MFS transporter [Coxiella endosymbiont of Amblyomma nuttalli]|uniref:MFS transporter n=1 Tax=Coxiella endosymbiont of Amblyomma nuttalli TaxID=2749996 RepID=UPI001BA943D4|nr:MFS transporter [Coxiella endosymbiont of Amblyomma nuttalli]QTS83820.1 Inner membrane transport protein YajR [Coxiella endosymbiont of Amblyomma nuttalli]